MKKSTLLLVCLLISFSCLETDYIDDRVDPQINISNPLLTLKIEDSYPFQAYYFNYVGEKIENPTVSWSSSDPSILEISESGLATGISFGSATITASLVTTEEGLTITNDDLVTVSESTSKETEGFEGQIISTSSYLLKGDYSIDVLENNIVRISFAANYKASTSLPGLYIYLGNNPNSIANAYEVAAVTVFEGAHFYDLPESIGLYDYNYILYWCKPFGVKVGEGQIQ